MKIYINLKAKNYKKFHENLYKFKAKNFMKIS